MWYISILPWLFQCWPRVQGYRSLVDPVFASRSGLQVTFKYGRATASCSSLVVVPLLVFTPGIIDHWRGGRPSAHPSTYFFGAHAGMPEEGHPPSTLFFQCSSSISKGGRTTHFSRCARQASWGGARPSTHSPSGLMPASSPGPPTQPPTPPPWLTLASEGGACTHSSSRAHAGI